MKHTSIILPVALAAALSATLLSACEAKDRIDPSRYEPYQEQLEALRLERETLEKAIKDTSALEADPICILCFEGAYASLMENAYPMLAEAGYPAVVAVREGTLPGQPGMITAEQATELSAAGWEFIPSGSATVPVVTDGALNPEWTADLDATLAALTGLGLPSPSCCAFAADSYHPLADPALVERSIPVALHRWSGENRDSGLKSLGLTLFGGSLADSGPVYRIGGATVYAGTSSAQLDVQNACDQRAVVAVCTGQLLSSVAAADEQINCTVDKFKLVLRDLPDYARNSGLRVTTFSSACAYKRDFEENLDHRKEQYEAFCEKAEKRIEEIHQEVSDILGQIGG